MEQLKKLLKSFSFVAITLVILVMFASFFPLRQFGLTETIYSGIISGFGSFLGGLVGGLVAFAVASSQMQNEKEREQQRQKTKYLNMLRGLLTELKHNKKILEFYRASNKEEYLQQLENDIWKQIRFDANNMLPTDLFEVLDEVYREFNDMVTKSIGYSTQIASLDLRIKALSKLESDILALVSK